MKSMKLMAGLLVVLMLGLGTASVYAKIEGAGSKAATSSQDIARKCPPFC